MMTDHDKLKHGLLTMINFLCFSSPQIHPTPQVFVLYIDIFFHSLLPHMTFFFHPFFLISFIFIFLLSFSMTTSYFLSRTTSPSINISLFFHGLGHLLASFVQERNSSSHVSFLVH